MIRINLLPERPEAEIWRKLEKALWIFWFSVPLTILLWAKIPPQKNQSTFLFMIR